MSRRQTWQARVRKTYASLEELQAYDSIYGIAARCGFSNAADMWEANPRIGGSTNPGDFGRATRRTAVH